MSQTAPQFTKITEYRANDVTVSFVPEKNVLGFTHRVHVLDTRTRKLLARDWLSTGCAVTAKAAQFFYDKHVHGVR